MSSSSCSEGESGVSLAEDPTAACASVLLPVLVERRGFWSVSSSVPMASRRRLRVSSRSRSRACCCRHPLRSRPRMGGWAPARCGPAPRRRTVACVWLGGRSQTCAWPRIRPVDPPGPRPPTLQAVAPARALQAASRPRRLHLRCCCRRASRRGCFPSSVRDHGVASPRDQAAASQQHQSHITSAPYSALSSALTSSNGTRCGGLRGP